MNNLPKIKNQQLIKNRIFALGPFNEHCMPYAPNICRRNFISGFKHRNAHVRNPINQGRINQLALFTNNWLLTHMTPLPKIDYTLSVFDEWIEDTHYNRATKKLRKFQFLRLRSDGFRFRRKYAVAEAFIKDEMYMEQKFARIINGRHDFAKVYFGPYIKKIEHQLYGRYPQYFAKGQTPLQLRDKIKKLSGHGRLIECDFSSFEGSIGRELMRATEILLFSHMLRNNPKILTSLLLCLDPPQHVPFQNVSYSKWTRQAWSDCRLSGDMWTSLANSFDNLMINMLLASERGHEFHGMVEGDDNISAWPVRPTAQDFAAFGLTAKILKPVNVFDSQFCGVHPSPYGSGAPRLNETMMKISWSTNTGATRFVPRLALYKAKLLSCLFVWRDVPVLSNFCYSQLVKLRHINPRFEKEDRYYLKELVGYDFSQNFEEWIQPISFRNRLWVHFKFTIPVVTQLRVEKTNVNFCMGPKMPYPHDLVVYGPVRNASKAEKERRLKTP